jgi:hypothetical protein
MERNHALTQNDRSIEELQESIVELVRACRNKELLEQLLEQLLPQLDVAASSQPSQRWHA